MPLCRRNPMMSLDTTKGRPFSMPEDRTRLGDSAVDVDARVSWLLRMSRLHQCDAAFAPGRVFIAALEDIGLHVTASSLSRWESGQTRPRVAMVAAYEQILGLPEGLLTTAVTALWRMGESDAPPSPSPFNPLSEDHHDTLDGLLDVLRSGKAIGPDWVEFGGYVAGPHPLYLHGDLWRELTHHLVDQLSRSVGVGTLQRLEAAHTLLKHRIATSFLLTAIGEYLGDPHAQVLDPAMAVLGMSPHPRARRMVLREFAHVRSPVRFEATLRPVTSYLRRHQYEGPALAFVESTMLTSMHQFDGRMDAFGEVILAMPEPRRTRLVAAYSARHDASALVPAARYGEWVTPRKAESLSEELAREVRQGLPAAARYGDEAMTPRLIREALFSAREDNRRLAAIVLRASPFREAVAARLVVVGGGTEHDASPSQVLLLSQIAGQEQEPVFTRWFPDASSQVARELAIAVGRLPKTRSARDVFHQRLGTGDAYLDPAILFLLGMRRDPLLVQVATDASLSEATRAGASWWMARDGAVTQ